MAKSLPNLQDGFLNQLRRESIPIVMYLMNGVQLKGLVKGFDSFTVVLENDGKQSMVYKHAVSTISPARAVDLGALEAEETSNGQTKPM